MEIGRKVLSEARVHIEPFGEEVERQDANTRCDQKSTNEQHKIGNTIEHQRAQRVRHDQRQSVSRTATKVLAVNGHHDVRVSIDELEKLFQTPKTTFATTTHKRDQTAKFAVISGRFFQTLLNYLNQGAQELANGNEQCSECNRAQMINERVFDAREQNQRRFGLGPIPNAKTAFKNRKERQLRYYLI